MGINFEKTLTLSVQVSDWEKSKIWYRDVLGLTLQYEMPEMGWCEFETAIAGVTIGLNRVEAGTTIVPSDAVTPTLGVIDIDAARTYLEGKGVGFAGETVVMEGLVKLAYFTDPDGNHLCLAQSLAEGPG